MSNAATIAGLKAVLAQGVLTVEEDGCRVTYRSSDDIRAEISRLEAEDLAASAPSSAYAATLVEFGND